MRRPVPLLQPKIKRLVAISFAEAETPPTITVTVDNGPAQTFQIFTSW
jgi:hypothetical protein